MWQSRLLMRILSYPGDSVALTFLLRCLVNVWHYIIISPIWKYGYYCSQSAGPTSNKVRQRLTKRRINDLPCQNKINQHRVRSVAQPEWIKGWLRVLVPWNTGTARHLHGSSSWLFHDSWTVFVTKANCLMLALYTAPHCISWLSSEQTAPVPSVPPTLWARQDWTAGLSAAPCYDWGGDKEIIQAVIGLAKLWGSNSDSK